MSLGAGPVEFHVNGLAKIYCFNPLVYLGYTSEAGVKLEFDPKFLMIYTDAFGDQVPEDIQNMGMLATLTFELIKWDQTVLAALQTHAPGTDGSATVGPFGTLVPVGKGPNVDTAFSNIIGTFLKQCNWNFPLYIARTSTNCEANTEPLQAGGAGASANGYGFWSCYVGPDSFNLGTKATRHSLTINCLPNSSGQLYQVGSAGL